MKHLLALLALLLLLPASLARSAPTPVDRRDGEIVIRLVPGTSLTASARATGASTASLDQLLQRYDASAALPIDPGSRTYRVRLAHAADIDALALQLAGLPNVVYAHPNYLRRAFFTPNDEIISQQWGLENIQAYAAWDVTTGGAITIAVIDTGVSADHPDLAGKVLPGYDFVNNDHDASDDQGHGTQMAGIAAARGNNGAGMAGICWECRILPVKVLDSRGRGDDATIARGIRWAVDNGARIISMSLGGPEDTQVLREAVTYAYERNVLIIAASGNGSLEGNAPNYPAAYPEVVAVSATGANDEVVGFSTTGDFVDIAAPGVAIWSLTPPGAPSSYGPANGTSSSCPHVSGTAALILTLRPELSAAQLADVLRASADDLGAPGADPAYGHGRLNTWRAVQLATAPDLLSRSRIEGTISGLPLDQAVVSLNTGQTSHPDGQGRYRFEGLAAGAYTVTARGPGDQVRELPAWVNGTQLSVATVDFSFTGDAAGFFAPVTVPSDGTTYFVETGHTLRGPFKAFWQQHGGLPIFGYPISEEFIERGEDGREYLVQYFERHRFELHPGNPAPYHVQLSRLGDATLRRHGRDWASFPRSSPQPGCMYFAASGHSICEPFLSYWRAHGLEFDGQPGKSEAESLALFGLPLSEPTVEILANGQPAIVQWFERARFESHGQHGVLLGLLSDELARYRGLRP